jgi:hypothetical protein
MAKKKNRTDKTKINRVQKATGATRKTNTRKVRAAAEAKSKVKAQAAKAAPKPQAQPKSAGVNRAEGIRLFKLAGKPSKEDFILVYGERGPKMTWKERQDAGVSAKQFQAALAAKQSGQK